MMIARQNKIAMYYSLQDREISIPYIDDEGNEYDTGETQIVYSEPVEFFAPFSCAGQEVESVPYGLSTADYEAVIMVEIGSPIKEGALIWKDSEIVYKAIGQETVPDETSADFTVVKVSPSLNFVKVMLKGCHK